MSTLQSPIFNRGTPTREFIDELTAWAKAAPDEIFAPNTNFDIFSKVNPELGPWADLSERKATLCLVMLVLAWFESSGDWTEGADSSKSGGNTNENAEAGAWQESWDGRKLDPSLAKFLADHGIHDGVTFQHRMKTDHPLAMSYAALLLRIDVRDFNRIANGPVRKGDERQKTWPNRRQLWDAHQSIYPWLNRDAVLEFKALLA